MKFSIPALFGRRHHADRNLSIVQDTYNEQAFVSHFQNDESFTDTYSTKTPLRSLIKTEFARLKGHSASEQSLEQNATPDKDNGPKRQYVWSKIVGRYSKAREAIVGRGIQCLFKHKKTDASFTHVDKPDTASHLVEYRDVDLGYRCEAIYPDGLAYRDRDDQIPELDFGLSAWWSSYSAQDGDLYDEASSGAGNWTPYQPATSRASRNHSPIASLYEPLPPLSPISETFREDSSRPTTGSTDRKDSGEFLRRLQTGSSVRSRFHSRNVSDASDITLPSSEDCYDLREAPAGENPSVLDRTTDHGAGHSIHSDLSNDITSHVAHIINEAEEHRVSHGDISEELMWLQAPPYLEFEWYEVKDSHDAMPFDTVEQMESSRRYDVDELSTDHGSQKGHFLHVEQPAGEDDRSFISTYPEDHEASTRTYGKFDAAFAQQVKDYSKLLDDLADPGATAQALELVSSRLSIYLNNNSSADIAFGRCAETEAAEKRQRMGLPDLSDLDAFLEDEEDEDADSGFHVGSAQIFQPCPAKPRPTPFADLEQFIGDDDLDFDLDPIGPGKLDTNSFMDWTLSANNDDETQKVSYGRTARKTRPELRRS
ncbi:hypothetical protein N0V82_000609 [Gnomoniopsis sp. IMI 355080]|nr:hypothetical protein N0V82_000609 [Gnomoniopsis sp. IMI 355080]